MVNKSLIYFTNNYPLDGTTEEAFMKSEIVVMAKVFSKVIVVPMNAGESCLDISWWPKNVVLDKRLSEEPRKVGVNRYLDLLNPLFILALAFEPKAWISRYKIDYLINSFEEGKAVKRYCEKLFNKDRLSPDKIVFYTFWFADASIGLGLLPHKIINKWVSRAHRYDLYDDQVPVRSKVFRYLSFRNLNKVLACSQNGAEYLSAKYPRWRNKIGTLFLGTEVPRRIPEYLPKNQTIRLITVARIEKVKRHLMTFELLNRWAEIHPEIKVEWTVAGGGYLEDELKKRIKLKAKDNLEVKLLGQTPNALVHEILSTEVFEWMIMLSESEGLPISFAEALSYGIPCIATDVGGVKEEVISGETGILLSENLTYEEFEYSLMPYINNPAKYITLRKTSKLYWEENLNEAELKKTLCKMLS